MAEKLTQERYIERLRDIQQKIKDPLFLRCYPALNRLLTHGKKNKRVDHMVSLIDHIIKSQDHLRPVKDASGRIFAYKLSLAVTYLASEIWAMARTNATHLFALFAGVLLVCRQESSDVEAHKLADEAVRKKAEIARKRNGHAPEVYTQAPYDVWFDEWTPAQMAIKERKAQEWFNGDHNINGLTKAKAIEIWGHISANAIYSNTRGKSKNTIEAEERLIMAYRTVSENTASPVVTKADILTELKRHEDRRTAADDWKRGKEALLIRERLVYKPLSKADRELYGLPQGKKTVWAILPNRQFNNTAPQQRRCHAGGRGGASLS